jgi:hypothetical protein
VPEMRDDQKTHNGESMIYAIIIICVAIFFMLKRKPEASLNNKLWHQVFNSPDQFTKIEWKK